MLDLPNSVDNTITFLKSGNYLADRSLSTALYLSLSLKRPLFLEGEAGVGKTEIAKVLSDNWVVNYSGYSAMRGLILQVLFMNGITRSR